MSEQPVVYAISVPAYKKKKIKNSPPTTPGGRARALAALAPSPLFLLSPVQLRVKARVARPVRGRRAVGRRPVRGLPLRQARPAGQLKAAGVEERRWRGEQVRSSMGKERGRIGAGL